jgi:hypothetical protein
MFFLHFLVHWFVLILVYFILSEGLQKMERGDMDWIYLAQNMNQLWTLMNWSGFGGLVVTMLASSTQDHGFKPGRNRRIFRAK